jgi:hypothetical protein
MSVNSTKKALTIEGFFFSLDVIRTSEITFSRDQTILG